MKKVVDLEKLAKLLNAELIDFKNELNKITTSSSDEVCEHTQ
jgi:cobalamin biosynthesis protein CbiG